MALGILNAILLIAFVVRNQIHYRKLSKRIDELLSQKGYPKKK